ncbi:hypothetical protein [uncultured Microbacterium sp.]|uniref:hypothetical protein n=1 Tax=uncultured Microbacterium sp. TaxID=191216 RepID=UPI0028DC6131|nr:hypothetical protein [uncultured Microbacterium sp.]
MTESATLERVLVDADPARTPRGSTPDARAVQDRERILRRARARAPRPRGSSIAGWAIGATAVAASAALAVAVFVPQTAAVAGAPAPLDFDEAGSVSDIVDDARTALSTGGPVEAQRTVRSASWSFSVDLGREESEIVPQLVALDWRPDLSATAVAYDGVPYAPDDAEANIGAEVSSSGEVSWQVDTPAGGFEVPLRDLVGSSRTEVLDLLHAYWLPQEYTASDVVTALSSVLGQWTPTNAQEAEMLAILAESDGVEALGSTVDRLGRAATALRVPTPDGSASDVVLISADTGRVIGIERTWLGEDDVFPTGAVISYQLWDVDEGILR